MRQEVLKVVYNTAAQLAAKAISAATTIVTTAIIARQFGEVGFASFLLMTGFATYFYLLTDFGVNAVVTKELSPHSHDRAKLSRYFNNILTFRFLAAIALILVLAAVVPVIPFRLIEVGTLKVGIVLGLLTLLAQAVYNSCTVIFQTTLSYSRLVSASLAGNLLFLALVIILTVRGHDLLPLVAANTLGALTVAGFALYSVTRMLGSVRFEFDHRLWRQLLLTALPLGLGISLTVVVAKADQLLLAILRLPENLSLSNDRALANYGLAYKIFENVLVFPTFFVNAVYPLMVQNFMVDVQKFRKVFWWAFYALLFSSLVLAALGWYFSDWLVSLIGGGGFNLAPQALRILLLSLPLFFTSSLFLFLMITQGQQKKVPYIYLAAAVFNVVLNLILIPRYGIWASAWLTGGTELLILVLVGYFSLVALRQKS